MKRSTTIAASLSLLALLALNAPAAAQDDGLGLHFGPSLGIPGIWALMAPGQKAEMVVSQPLDNQQGSARIVVLFSPIQSLGVLDLANAGILLDRKVMAGTDLRQTFQVPQAFDGLMFSVQAFALYQDGSIANSSVVTVFFDSSQTSTGQDTGSSKDGGAADVNGSTPSDSKPVPSEPAQKPAAEDRDPAQDAWKA